MPATVVGQRSLTKVPLQLLEAAIADALSEIAGVRLHASIKQLDLQPTPTATFSDEYDLTIRVRRSDAETLSATGGDATAEASMDEGESDSGASNDITGGATLTGLTGRQLNHEWDVGARHALYRHQGHWYHQLRRFPGAVFDYNGYVLFRTEQEFRDSPHLHITQDVHVPAGIASIPGYVLRRSSVRND